MKLSRIALVALLAAYVALGIHALVVHLEAKPLPQFLMEDYGYYVQALARWREGQSPYADHTIGTAFLYPPPALLLVAGFEALGPLAIKFAGYATLSLLALLGTVALVVHGCRHDAGHGWWSSRELALRERALRETTSDRRVMFALAVVLPFAPVAWCLYLGQVNLLVMLMLAAGFFLAERHPYAAGTAIAIGASIKLTPVVLLVLMLQPRYRRVFIGFGASLAVLCVASAAVFGTQPFVDYVGTVRALKDSFPLGFNGSLSLVNTLYLLAGFTGAPSDGWQGIVQTLWTAGLAGLMLLSAWLGRDQRQLTFALVVLAMTVMPNVLWYHHLVFVIPALLTLWLSPESSPKLRAWALIAFGVMQLDAVLSPRFDKLTTTPVLVLLLGITFVTLAKRSTVWLGLLRRPVNDTSEVRGPA